MDCQTRHPLKFYAEVPGKMMNGTEDETMEEGIEIILDKTLF